MLQKNCFFYSIKILAQNRKLYSLKNCYKNHLEFIKYQQNTSELLSNRIVENSHYTFSQRKLKEFYIKYLRKIFLLNLIDNKNSINFFLSSYKQYIGLKDLNRVLL